MRKLNYQHLLYFWTVAREGSIVAAARELNVTSPTISIQLKALEAQFDRQLFERVGRGLRLTDVGRIAFRYADSIFSTGRELEGFLDGRRTGASLRLDIGIATFLPKLVAWELIEPATKLDEFCHIVTHEAGSRELVTELMLHQLDLILSDVPLDGGSELNLFNHLLGESAISFFGSAALAAEAKPDFPNSLERVGVLLPSTGTEMRRTLDAWFSRHRVEANIVAEFDDLSLLKVAGEHGLGVFPAPDTVAEVAVKHYGVEKIAVADGVFERFYAVSMERQFDHPAVAAIVGGAGAFLGESPG